MVLTLRSSSITAQNNNSRPGTSAQGSVCPSTLQAAVSIQTPTHTGTPGSGILPAAPTIQALGLSTFQADTPAPVLPPMILPPTASPPAGPTHHTVSPLSPRATPHNPLAGFPDIPAIPQKLLEAILTWQYTDLSELLPDQLRSSATNTPSIDSHLILVPQRTWESQKKRKRQIADIATWVQLYSTYMLILSSKHPQALPELISHQLFIVKAAMKFEYPSWLYYDTEYRKWAAATQHHQWSHINTQLYSLAFTGQGNPVSWCPVCQVDGGQHTFDCPRYPIPSEPIPPQQPQINHRPPRSPSPPPPKRPRQAVDHCISYNQNDGNCKFAPSCRYPHKCAVCGFLGHPATHCPNKRRF